MILPGVNLFYQSTNSWAVWSNQDKQVPGVKPHFLIAINNLNVRQPLPIGTNLILAFDNVYSVILENSRNFFSRLHIKIQNSCMPLCCSVMNSSSTRV